MTFVWAPMSGLRSLDWPSDGHALVIYSRYVHSSILQQPKLSSRMRTKVASRCIAG
jgi:hypothetical protein